MRSVQYYNRMPSEKISRVNFEEIALNRKWIFSEKYLRRPLFVTLNF